VGRFCARGVKTRASDSQGLQLRPGFDLKSKH
jgi:hypothetical protein